MTTFIADSADAWRHNSRILQAARHLIAELHHRHPQAATLLGADPITALPHIPGLRVVIDHTARNPVCPIEGTYDAATTTIRYRPTGNDARDRFTLLHELGHHLLAINDGWNYDVVPLLTQAKVKIHVEERLVNAFASLVLIPDEQADSALARGVTAVAVRDLYLSTEASATACLARCLLEPGDRLVMLANGAGHVWYAQSNGEPYAPSTEVEQPAIAHGALRAIQTDGTARFTGHEGIRYRSGSTNTRVAFDICTEGSLVFVIVEPTPFDLRVDNTRFEFSLTCVAGCGATFTPEEAPGRCATCSETRCPRCRGCECPRETYCTRCTIALPTARATAGMTVCEECE